MLSLHSVFPSAILHRDGRRIAVFTCSFSTELGVIIMSEASDDANASQLFKVVSAEAVSRASWPAKIESSECLHPVSPSCKAGVKTGSIVQAVTQGCQAVEKLSKNPACNWLCVNARQELIDLGVCMVETPPWHPLRVCVTTAYT